MMMYNDIMSFTKLSKILPVRIAHYGLSKQATASQVCFIAAKFSNNRFEPVSFKNNTLVIKVNSPLASQELQADKEKIINQINQKLGQDLVKKLRFRT